MSFPVTRYVCPKCNNEYFRPRFLGDYGEELRHPEEDDEEHPLVCFACAKERAEQLALH